MRLYWSVVLRQQISNFTRFQGQYSTSYCGSRRRFVWKSWNCRCSGLIQTNSFVNSIGGIHCILTWNSHLNEDRIYFIHCWIISYIHLHITSYRKCSHCTSLWVTTYWKRTVPVQESTIQNFQTERNPYRQLPKIFVLRIMKWNEI